MSNIFKKMYKENNINATKNLVKLFNSFNIKNLIFASIAAIFVNQKFNKSIKEDSDLRPANYYGKTKKIIYDESKVLKK